MAWLKRNRNARLVNKIRRAFKSIEADLTQLDQRTDIKAFFGKNRNRSLANKIRRSFDLIMSELVALDQWTAMETKTQELREALAREVQTNIELTTRLEAINENKVQAEEENHY